jgi:hypothetical protein
MSLFAKLATVAAAAAAAIALPAAAQVVGNYFGTTADGNSISFTVATDENTGLLTIVQGGISFSALCNDGSTFNSGWGYGVDAPDIVNRKVKYVQTYPYFVFTADVKFSADGQSATGTFMSVSPELAPSGPKPKRALFCTSASQSFGVSLDAPGAKHPVLPQMQFKTASH